VSLDPILFAPMCLAPMLVICILWIELESGTSLFMPLLYLYSSCNKLIIKSNSFHGCKITDLAILFSIRVYLSLTTAVNLCVDVISNQHKMSNQLLYYTTIFDKFGQNPGFLP